MLSLAPNNVTYPLFISFYRFVPGEMELEEKDALWKLLKAFSWSNQKVNRDFGAQDSKIEALEVKDNDIPELRPRNRKVNFRPGSQPKSTGPHGQPRGQPRRHPTKTHARLSHIY